MATKITGADIDNEYNEIIESTKTDILFPNTNKPAIEELVKNDEPQIKVISEEAKSKNWKKVFSLLDKSKNLVNKADPDTGMAPLHYAAEANDVEAVQKILCYPACDPAVKTLKSSSHGAGKTPAEITTSQEVQGAIRWREKKLLEKHTDVPIYVSVYDSNLILKRYIGQAMELNGGDKCDDYLDANNLKLFPEMGSFIFDFINKGDNWKHARDAVAKEIYYFDAAKNLHSSTMSEDFFKELIRCYTGSFSSDFNRKLRTQATELQHSNFPYKGYAALTNALLFENFLKLPVCTETTYKSLMLGNSDIEKYTEGREFAWLSFTSSTSREQEDFPGNCIFEIDNSEACIWSPRRISDISCNLSEEEYLYPCGAQFRVTKVEQMYRKNKFYIKLIFIPDPWLYAPIDTKDLEILIKELRERAGVLAGARRELDKIHVKMSKKLPKIKQKIEANTNYETLIIQKTIHKHFIKYEEAYHCSNCNFTCHYPCPETDMQEGRCIVSGTADEEHCEMCPQKCHSSFHKKVNFVNEIQTKTETKLDKKMKSKFDRAKKKEEVIESKRSEVDAAVKDVLAKLSEWEMMTLKFDRQLSTGQTPVNGDAERKLKLYSEITLEVEALKLELEKSQLI